MAERRRPGGAGVTTLQEISRSASENRRYWTHHARFCLTCYRETGDKLERHAFRAAMRNRRAQTYLNDELRGDT